MSSNLFFSVFLFLTSLSYLHAQSADTDGDGMPNDWETLMGLSPTNAQDAFADKDGDFVPNLWEYARGTLANDANSKPAFDAVVSTTEGFSTIQAAYDSLSTDPNYFSLVEVQRGIHPASLDGTQSPKRVAWIGQKTFDRNRPLGLPTLQWKNPGDGLKISSEAVFTGIVIDGVSVPTVDYPTANVIISRNRPALHLVKDPSFGTTRPEVRLVNCIIRNWITLDPQNSAHGSIVIEGCELWLVHTTVFRAAARNPQNPSQWEHCIEPRAGTSPLLRARNSVIWGGIYNSNQTLIPIQGVSTADAAIIHYGTSTTTIVQGAPNGQLGNNPNLLPSGFVKWIYASEANSSAEVFSRGLQNLDKWDFQGELRPATAIDLGADEWVNADSDYLPDWWELYWFGSLASQNHLGDADGDGKTNLQEYNLQETPIDDFDFDGLSDAFELSWSSSLESLHGPLGDEDNDKLTNKQELVMGTNPLVPEADADFDADGLFDLWEQTHFQSLSAQGPLGDPDLDGFNNLQEQAMKTNPNVANNAGGDIDKDGWSDEEEILLFGSAVQNPNGDFDGDGLSNEFEMTVSMTSPILARSTTFNMDDGTAWRLGLLALEGTSERDPDEDFLISINELNIGTDPLNPDTDFDGVTDAIDAFPLDPNLSALPISVSTAPTVTLLHPTAAILLP